MIFFQLSLTFIFIVCIIGGSIIILRNPKNPLSRNIFYICLSAMVWSGSYFMWSFSQSYEQAYFWNKALMIGAIAGPIFYLNLVIQFLQIYKQKIFRFIYWASLALMLVMIGINIFTSTIVEYLSPKLIFPYWSNGGVLFIPLLIIFFLYIIFASILLMRSYLKEESSIKKLQIKYVFIGTVIGFTSASTNYFLWFDIPIKPYPMVLVILYPLSIFYAILRTRFLDIKITFQKTLARIFSLFASIIILAIPILGIFFFIEKAQTIQLIFFILATLFLAAIFFPVLQKHFDPFFLSIFSPKEFLAKKRLKQIQWWSGMTQKQTMKETYEEMLSVLTSYIPLKSKQEIRMYLYDAREKRYYLVYPRLEYDKEYIKGDTFIAYELEHNPTKILVTDELIYLAEKDDRHRKRYEKLLAELKELKTSAFVPLNMGGKDDEIGLLLLGKKVDNKPYSTQDIEFLNSYALSWSNILAGAMIRTGWEERIKRGK